MPLSSSCCFCRALPHGSYSVLVVIFATLAWTASLFQDDCNYALVSGPIVQQLDPTFTQTSLPYLQFGIAAYREPKVVTTVIENPTNSDGADGQYNYTISLTGVCTEYPEEQLIDATWKTARSFAFLALVLGGAGTVFIWCSTCFVFSKVTWRWTGYELLLASLCQGLVYLWFTTQLCAWNTCTLSYGSKTDILAVVFWFLAGIFIVVRYPTPKRELIASDEDEDQNNIALGNDGIMKATMATEMFSNELELGKATITGSSHSQGSGEDTVERTYRREPEEVEDDKHKYPYAEIA